MPNPTTTKEGDIVERGLFSKVRAALESCYPVRASRPSYMASKLDEEAHAVVAALSTIESDVVTENERLREALERISRYDVGLQGLIEDGKDTPTNVANYYAAQIERRRKIARAALSNTDEKGD